MPLPSAQTLTRKAGILDSFRFQLGFLGSLPCGAPLLPPGPVPSSLPGVDTVREVSEPAKMGEALALAGCPSQNLCAGPRYSFLGAVVGMFGVL